jgi:hypothetical protein
MLRLATILGALAWGAILITAALADTASTTTVAASPWVTLAAPYVNLIVEALVGAAITWGVALFQRWTGRKIQESLVNSIKSAAATEAGVAMAKAENNLAGRSIDVKSPIVAQGVTALQGRIPDILKNAGATPEALSAIVAGEIGKLQASAPPAAPVVITTGIGGQA